LFRLKPGVVSLYSCGPTVYSRAHIGNMKAAVFADLVARVLIESGYHVRRVMNITDVGHLVGDGDHGEDKMAKGAREEQASPQEIAERYTNLFLDDLRALNIDTSDILFPRATDYIRGADRDDPVLEKRASRIAHRDGVYFDTANSRIRESSAA
jgi:cysteinyl-tRNA synthetase